MTHDEKKAAILAVARKYPQGIERDALLREAGVRLGTGYQTLSKMNAADEIGYVRGERIVLWTALEHLEGLRAGMQCKSDKLRRRWPETSSWTPPQPRIPSVWHLGQL